MFGRAAIMLGIGPHSSFLLMRLNHKLVLTSVLDSSKVICIVTLVGFKTEFKTRV